MSTQISHPKRYTIISASTKYYPVINYTPKIYFITDCREFYFCIKFLDYFLYYFLLIRYLDMNFLTIAR